MVTMHDIERLRSKQYLPQRFLLNLMLETGDDEIMEEYNKMNSTIKDDWDNKVDKATLLRIITEKDSIAIEMYNKDKWYNTINAPSKRFHNDWSDMILYFEKCVTHNGKFYLCEDMKTFMNCVCEREAE